MKNFSIGSLVVPVTMLSFLIAYWLQAYDLSFEARLFPALLTLALLGFLTAISVQWARSPSLKINEVMSSRLHDIRRVLVIGLPVLLLLFWSHLGGMVFVLLVVLLTQLALGERRIVPLLALPVGLSITINFLFSTVLHARVPMGVMGIFGS